MNINTQNQLQQAMIMIENNNKQFIEFKDIQFPEFMEETKKSIAIDVLEKVNQLEGQLVTMDLLKETLE